MHAMNLTENKSLIGAEIGVFKGENAESILTTLNIKQLYLIDPYEPYTNVAEDEVILNHALDECLLRLYDKFKTKITFLLTKSEDAVNDIPNNLDFVYIDGDHKYNMVKKDIQNYYPKLRRGGILGGHDYYAMSEVCKAVDEWVKRMHHKLYVKNADWWIVKP